jgi:hypothetical protein
VPGTPTRTTLRASSVKAGLTREEVRHIDAVLIVIRAAAPDRLAPSLKPAMNASDRFGIVTLEERSPRDCRSFESGLRT